MNAYAWSFIAAVVLLAAACSSSYQPAQHESAAQVFSEACMGCHKPKAGQADKYFAMAAGHHNETYIVQKIRKGSLIMPSYPAFTDQQVAELAQFVLEHSSVKQD